MQNSVFCNVILNIHTSSNKPKSISLKKLKKLQEIKLSTS